MVVKVTGEVKPGERRQGTGAGCSSEVKSNLVRNARKKINLKVQFILVRLQSEEGMGKSSRVNPAG